MKIESHSAKYTIEGESVERFCMRDQYVEISKKNNQQNKKKKEWEKNYHLHLNYRFGSVYVLLVFTK